MVRGACRYITAEVSRACIFLLPADPDEGNFQLIHADLSGGIPEAVHQITVHSNTNQITTTAGRSKAHSNGMKHDLKK
jgi:hypothetical protein